MANSSFFKNTGTTTQIQQTALASATSAAQSAADALASENAVTADLLLTNADVVSTNADVVTTAGAVTTALGHSNTAQIHKLDAQKLATTIEDSQFTLNDGVTTGYSALHHAAKAAASSTTAQGHSNDASGHSTDASNSKDDASKLAITAEDSQYTLSDGTTQGYSALHYAAKASASVGLATTAQTGAETALDNFTDQYLGSKDTSGGEPTTDNDGDALVNGTLFWDDTNGIMKVWNGTAWVAAYASSGGALVAVNNLSDLSDAGLSRTNLGLGTVATLDTGTAAGDAIVLDGSARLPAVDGSQLTGLPAGYTGWTVSDGTNSENIASTDTVSFVGSGATSVSYDTGTNTLTVSSTDNDTTYTAATTSAEGLMSAADKTKLDGVEELADVTDTANVTAAGAAMLTGATFSGAVTATSFSGDGSSLTNLPAAGIGNVVEDVTPELGGNLSLNSQDITGTGNVNITGTVTASGGFSGNASTATQLANTRTINGVGFNGTTNISIPTGVTTGKAIAMAIVFG